VFVLQTVCLSSTRFVAHLVNQQVVSTVNSVNNYCWDKCNVKKWKILELHSLRHCINFGDCCDLVKAYFLKALRRCVFGEMKHGYLVSDELIRVFICYYHRQRILKSMFQVKIVRQSLWRRGNAWNIHRQLLWRRGNAWNNNLIILLPW